MICADQVFVATRRNRSFAGLFLCSVVLVLTGCAHFVGARLDPPPELEVHGVPHWLLVEHDSFNTDRPRQTVSLRRKTGPRRREARLQVKADFGRERGAQTKREAGDRGQAFVITVNLPGSGRALRVSGFRRTGAVESDAPTLSWARGDIFSGGRPIGRFEADATIAQFWMDSHECVVAFQGFHRQYVIYFDREPVAYGMIDWGHWAFGERAFDFLIQPKLDEEVLARSLFAFLVTKVLLGA